MDNQRPYQELIDELATMRIQLQLALENLKLRDTILDRLPATVYIKDRESRHIYANYEDLAIKGVTSRDEIVNRTDIDFFSPELAAELLEDERRVMATGIPLIDKEEHFKDDEGNERFLITTKLPWYDDDGQTRGIIGIGRDITWHKQEQDILNEINRHIVTADSVTAIMRQIVEGAMRLSKSTSGTIFLVDTTQDVYQITDFYHYPNNTQPPAHAAIMQEVITRGEAIHIPDTATDARTVADFQQESVCALLALPLKRGDRIIGVFFVNDDKLREFSFTEIRHLSTMADYAVAALEKMLLLAETHAAQRQIIALHNASTALIDSSRAKVIFENMIQNALKATDADWISVVLIDDHHVVTDLINYPPDERFQRQDIRPRPNGNSYGIFDSGLTYIVRDTAKEPHMVNRITLDQGFKSVIGLPLTVESHRRIGVMWLHYREKQYFSSLQIASYELYARQGAMAYNNALRINKIEQIGQMMQAIARLIPLGDKNASLERIVRAVPLVTNCSSITLFVYDNLREELEHPPTVYGAKYPEQAKRGPIVDPHSIVYKMLNRDTPYISADALTDPLVKHLPFVSREGVKTFFAAPLIVGDQKTGVMFINYDTPHIFSLTEQEDIQTFVDQAAVAVHSAQQLEITRENAEAFAALNTISVDLSSTESVDAILEKIVQHAVQITHATDSVIYLIEKQHELYAITKKFGPDIYPAPILNVPSIAWQVVHTGQPFVLNHIQPEHSGIDRQLLALRVESMVVLPLKSKDNVVGILYVYHKDVRRFTIRDITILSTLSNDAAIAIANEQQRTQRILVLDDIAQAIAVENDRNRVLHRILELIQQRIMPDLVFADIRLFDKEKNYLLIAASVGKANSPNEDGIAYGEGITGWVAKHRQHRYVADVFDPVDGKDYQTLSFLTRSELAVPLLDGDELLGVLNIESPVINGFTVTDIQLAIAIANLTVVAYQSAKRFDLKIEAIGQMARSIEASSKGAHQTLQAIMSGISAVTTVFNMGPCLIEIITFQESTDSLKLLEGWSNGLTHASDIPIEMRGVFKEVIQTRTVKVVDKVKLHRLYAQPRCDDANSQMVIPLIQNDIVYGLLSIGHPHNNAFSGNFPSLGYAVGHLVMMAIKHVKQYEDLKSAKGKIDGQIAIIWMNLASSIWYHEVRGEAAAINNLIYLLKQDLEQEDLENRDKHLSQITASVRRILDKKELIPINAANRLLRQPLLPFLIDCLERICQLVGKPDITLHRPIFEIDKTVMVEINAEWLEKVLEILVTNGVNAMEKAATREMGFRVWIEHDQVVIAVTDTGKGMPLEIREALTSEVLPPYNPNKKGLGIGLLVAQTIMAIFSGSLKVMDHQGGTRMVISLPIV